MRQILKFCLQSIRGPRIGWRFLLLFFSLQYFHFHFIFLRFLLSFHFSPNRMGAAIPLTVVVVPSIGPALL